MSGAMLAGLLCGNALAADPLPPLELVLEQRSQHALPGVKAVGANPERAYPPSCLSDPLPTTPRGPTVTQNANLGDWGSTYTEQVAITAWRVACSGGKSAILVKFDRATAVEGRFPAPDVPLPNVDVPNSNADIYLNINAEPNTRRSEVGGNPIINDSTLVIEHFPGAAFDLNQAFALAIDTYTVTSGARITLQMPAYNAATHPDGSQSLEINGYLTGSWYDAAHSGEGIFFEVAELDNGARFVFFAWFTYGPTGQPYWLVGNTTVAADARTISVPTLYLTGGGFAGNFGAPVPSQPWGNVTFAFPNCGTMALGFESTHGSSGIPQGQGARTWTRLSSINGFVCQ
jgi:hypothetical protein